MVGKWGVPNMNATKSSMFNHFHGIFPYKTSIDGVPPLMETLKCIQSYLAPFWIPSFWNSKCIAIIHAVKKHFVEPPASYHENAAKHVGFRQISQGLILGTKELMGY